MQQSVYQKMKKIFKKQNDNILRQVQAAQKMHSSSHSNIKHIRQRTQGKKLAEDSSCENNGFKSKESHFESQFHKSSLSENADVEKLKMPTEK